MLARREPTDPFPSLLLFFPPFLAQGAALDEEDMRLVSSLVSELGAAIESAYLSASGGRQPASRAKSLVAATAFDDLLRSAHQEDSPVASS
jgi:hypothetical protein